jgi:hypothetical protein
MKGMAKNKKKIWPAARFDRKGWKNRDNMAKKRREEAQNHEPRGRRMGNANPAIKFESRFPGWTRSALTLADHVLPAMGGIGAKAARGYENESAWSPSGLTAPSDREAARNNG